MFLFVGGAQFRLCFNAAPFREAESGRVTGGMHSVIRKRQGLPWQPEEPKGMSSNLSHLVGVQVQAGPFPTDELGLAYSQRSHPKLVRQVVAEDDVLRRKALAHVCGQLRYARETAGFLPAGIVPALNQSAEHATDAETRTLATAALARLVLEGNGREHMLKEGASFSVPVLLRLVVDPEPEVRKNVLATVLRLGKDFNGAAALVAGGAVKLLVTRCTEETTELLAPVLAALEAVMMSDETGLKQAIALKAIEVVCKLLSQGPSMEALEPACFCLATLTVGSDEKIVAMTQGCVPILIANIAKMIHASDDAAGMIEKVATAAAAALMSLTIDNDCKAEAVKQGAVKSLSPLLQNAIEAELAVGLDHSNTTLTANVTKCMANLAEHPLGRKQLHAAALGDLIALAETSEELMTKNVAIAVQKVTWKP